MDDIEMTGNLTIAFVIAIVMVLGLAWLVKKSKADKSSSLVSRRPARTQGSATDGIDVAVKWIDTIRRDGASLAIDDATTLQTLITQRLDQPTVRDDGAVQTVHELPRIPASTDLAIKPLPIKAPELPVLETDTAAVDRKIAALHKEATSAKGKDWPSAIAALEKAAVLDAAHSRWNDMTRMVRLPTFLQQAGRFDEAMAEFDRLAERIPAYIQEHSASNNELARSASLHREYEILYDKMRLACKREKQHELAEKYAQKSAVHREALGDLKELKKSKRKKRADIARPG